MPVIPIAIAAVSVAGVGAAGFGAVLAGTASLATTFAAVGAVGAVLGAVGQVAGIDELKTAGMVIGGIGGIGALGSAVGAFGEGATLNTIFGSAEAATATGGSSSSLINGAGGWLDAEAGMMIGADGAMTSAGGSGVGAMDFGGIVTTGAKLGGYNPVGEMEGPDMGPTTTPSTRNTVTATTKVDPKLATQAKVNEMEGPDTSSAVVKADVQKPTGITVDKESGVVKTEEPSFWGSSMGKMLGMGVIQAGGSFLEGAFDEVKPAQAAAYMAQAEANNAQAALDKKQLSNMNDGIPVARRMDITGRVAGPGIINRPAGALV